MRNIRLIAVLLLLALLLTACGGDPGQTETDAGGKDPVQTAKPVPEGQPEPELQELAPIEPAGSYQDVAERLVGDLLRLEQRTVPEDDPRDIPIEDQSAELDGSGDAGETVLDPGMEQSDLVKTDGRYIYCLDSYGLTIVSADGADSRILSCTHVDRTGSGAGTGWMDGLYVFGERVAVVYSLSDYGTDENGRWYDIASTHIAILDVSDRSAPELVTDVAVDGSCLESRLVGGKLNLVTNVRLWNLGLEVEDPADLVPCLWSSGKRKPLDPEKIYLCPNPGSASFTLASVVDLESGEVCGALAFTGASDAACMDGEGMYLARTVYNDAESEPFREEPYRVVSCATRVQTEIKRVTRGADGALSFAGSALISGSLLSPSSLDVQDGCVRAATRAADRRFAAFTDENHGWTNYEIYDAPSSCAVTVLDRELNLTGRIEDLASGRSMRTCRFLGGVACLIPEENGEAVVAVDLSDPAAPALTDAPANSGSDALMQLYAPGLLFSLSLPKDEFGLQLSMYDVSSPGKIAFLNGRVVSEFFDSQALRSRRSLVLLPEQGLIAFPVDGGGKANYAVFSFDGAKLAQKGTLALEYLPDNARGLLIDGKLYICSSGATYVVDASTLELLASVTNAEG